MGASIENLKKWDDAFKKPDALNEILKLNGLKGRAKMSKNNRVNLKIGDVVEILESGDPERDLMYRGWKAVVTDIDDDSGDVWVSSDVYTRRTGKLQAVSFRNKFPEKLLKRSE